MIAHRRRRTRRRRKAAPFPLKSKSSFLEHHKKGRRQTIQKEQAPRAGHGQSCGDRKLVWQHSWQLLRLQKQADAAKVQEAGSVATLFSSKLEPQRKSRPKPLLCSKTSTGESWQPLLVVLSKLCPAHVARSRVANRNFLGIRRRACDLNPEHGTQFRVSA